MRSLVLGLTLVSWPLCPNDGAIAVTRNRHSPSANEHYRINRIVSWDGSMVFNLIRIKDVGYDTPETIEGVRDARQLGMWYRVVYNPE